MKKPFRAQDEPVPRVPKDLVVRQAPIKGFPYHVIYPETSETIHLLAFAHDKRRSAYWLLRSGAGRFRGG